MQRELKFRIWDKTSSSWVVGPCDYSQLGKIFSLNCGENSVENWVFQQFTGLTDKNGKEIYEGDFLQGQDYELPVPVIFSGAAFRLKYSNRELEFHESSNQIQMTVVGNIFENPELLKWPIFPNTNA